MIEDAPSPVGMAAVGLLTCPPGSRNGKMDDSSDMFSERGRMP
jgi:hypothetical protein